MIPDYQSLMLPILKFFSDGQEKHLKSGEAEAFIKQEFNLSEEDVNTYYPPPSTARDTILMDRMGWAKTYLGKAALLEPSGKRGYWKITEAGHRLLQKNISVINIRVLRELCPEFTRWRETSRGQRKGEKLDSQSIEENHDETNTPEEQLEVAFHALRSNLISNILEQLKIVDPYMFEQIVIDLLVKMGYGGSRGDMAQVTRKSRDGGIDGVIKEDRLGLDMIYVQAKRWQGNVGRGEIQGFSGAMTGKGVVKGVFVTTGGFAKDAKEFTESLSNQKIRLIDGDYLADLMIQYNLGVSTKSTYELKEVDRDYFNPD